MDITDTQLQAAQLQGAEGRSDEVRGARLAALQTALLKASAEENFRRTLVFHHVVKEPKRSRRAAARRTTRRRRECPRTRPELGPSLSRKRA